MRILAIRGKNLASLIDFELDLATGPLAETGIFAITGPTGAGKSTLLDALCLALYDQTPRLDEAREVPIGEHYAHAADPRSVLRRGAIEGRAEVDFEGKNGRFRAIWAVRRARKKADGKLQAQEMALFRLGDLKEISGGTKTETLKAIQAEIGLSFQEFRRAVLLAQGDFAAFLEAKPDERAELLEKMTGTGLYAELSKAAYVRAKEEQEKEERLLEEKARRSPLPELARAELIDRRDSSGHTIERLRQTLFTLRERLAHATAVARLRIELTEAEQAHLSAEDALREAEGARAEVELGEKIELLRPTHESLKEAERAFAERADASLLAGQQLRTAKADRDREKATAASTEAGLQALLTERDRMKPELTRARALDVELREAEAQLVEVTQARAEVLTHRERCKQRKDDATDGVEKAEADRASLVAWLTANEEIRTIAAQWGRWSVELERSATAQAEQEAIGRELGVAEAARAEASRLAEEAKDALGARSSAVVDAKAQCQAATAALEAHRKILAPAEVQASLERLGREQVALDGLKTALSRALKLERKIEEEEKRHSTELKKAKAAKKRGDGAKAQKKELEAKLAEVTTELEQLEAKESLAARRSELLEVDQPCPLCGALEHPLAGHEAPKNPRLSSLRGMRTRLVTSLEEVKAEIAAADLGATKYGDLAKGTLERKALAEQELEERRGVWKRGHEQLMVLWSEVRVPNQRDLIKLRMLLPESAESDADPGLGEVGAFLARLLDELRRHSAEDEALALGVETLRRQEDHAEQLRFFADEKLDHARALSLESQGALSELRVKAEGIAARLKSSEDALFGAFQRVPNWQANLRAQPSAFRRSIGEAVESYEAKALDERTKAEELRDLAQRVMLLDADLDRLRARESEIQKSFDARTDRAAALADARRRVLEGREAAVVEANLESAIADTAERAKTAALAAEHADRTLAGLEERVIGLHEAADAAARRRDEANDGWRRALSTSGLAVVELEAGLMRDPSWIAGAKARLEALAERRVRTETALFDRRARFVAEEAKGPGEDPLLLAAEIERHEPELQAAHLAIARATAELEEDDRLRAELAAMGPRLDAQHEAASAWAEISQVIGSADGKRFRTFAQSLTLEALIEEANQHLAQLRPRYRLERVVGVDMELLVIDRDLADEPRAIASLSGGETFLVSLALALGLASMSAKDVRLGSLFIDEGFGSLDRESLEIALGTLDQLQAEGRVVGLVSHIPDLAERLGYQVEVRPISPGTSELVVRRV